MEAIHFGDTQRPLFGLYYPAQGQQRRSAVLLCQAWGPEYMRAYRGIKTLTQLLAAQGFECLRFDYSGTGDSEGPALDARIEHWFTDIQTAARELMDRSGADKLVIFGHRSGALLAAEACRRGLHADKLLALDAPANGEAFVTAMRRVDESEDRLKNRYRSVGRRLPPSATNELCGHAWPAPLANAIADLPPVNGNQLLWLHSKDHSGHQPPDAQHWQLDSEGHWHEPLWINSPWCPTPSLQKLAQECATWLS